MRKMRSVIGAAALAVASAGMMLAAAGSAQADPGNCTITYPSSNHIASVCTTGTGHQRLHMVLNALDPRNGQMPLVGNWAAPGESSTITYPSWTIANVWIEYSNS